jgi:hypothetical protein
MGFKARSADHRHLATSGSKPPRLKHQQGAQKQDFDAKLRLILDDRTRMHRLLMLEKKRRGLSAESLVFVGTKNLANYYWCAMQAVLISRKRSEEEMFFSAYIKDRLRYSFELGFIDSLPEDDEAILSIGDTISLADIESLLKRRSDVPIEKDASFSLDERIDMLEAWEKEQGTQSPFWHGEEAEVFVAEKYPTIRWNFARGGYVIVGIPDGLTEDFVYEFKMVGKSHFGKFSRPVARAQANLYGHFYRRPRRRLQFFLRDVRRVETEEGPVEIEHANATLTKFRAADAGEQPLPPRPWKCKTCPDYIKEQCPIRQD